MKFLLVNINVAVKKIFNIASRKANISLDCVGSLSEISIQEDYDCIFIDDGVLNTGDFQSIKSKMIATKFCLIISKDSKMIPGFDNYIRKPFLPTDIYEVLKQEKRNDMSFSSFESEIGHSEAFDANSNLDNNISNIDLLDEIDDSNMNVNINNIDLSEFDDNNDEFLSGVKDNMPILNPQNSEETMIKNNNLNDNDEIKFTYSDDSDIDDFGISDSSMSLDNSNTNNQFDVIGLEDSTESSSNISSVNVANNVSNNKLNEQNDILPDIVTDNKTNSANTSNASTSNANTNYTANNIDDIDFSSIFAMQDEFLRDQNKDKLKGIIGGDIYTKKENTDTSPKDTTKDDKSTIENQLTDTTTTDRMKVNISQESIVDNTKNNIDANQAGVVDNFDELDSLDDVDFDDELDFLDKDFQIEQEQKDTSKTESDYQESLNDDFDIGKLSDEELDNLDDETLLKLQEEPVAFDEPKILNKSDIDEVTHILEDTQDLNNNLNSNDVKIANNGLDSITQEAFSEAIDETNINDDFSFDDDLTPLDSAVESEAIEESTIPNQVNDIQGSHNNIDANVAPNIASNPNIDLTEIIKSFPVDKLRELLSGVQITINITFPTKK